MGFHLSGSVQHGNTTYLVPICSHYCRELAIDAALDTMLNKLSDVLGKKLGANVHNDGHVVLLWALQSQPIEIRFDVQFPLTAWNRLLPVHCDGIAQFIRNYYGLEMVFDAEPRTVSAGFANERIQGFSLIGDQRVVPAFFWSVGILREFMSAATPPLTTFDAEKIVARIDDSFGMEDDDGYTHSEAYERLLTGDEPDAWHMLANCCGPIDSYDNSMLSIRQEKIILADVVKTAHYKELINDLS